MSVYPGFQSDTTPARRRPPPKLTKYDLAVSREPPPSPGYGNRLSRNARRAQWSWTIRGECWESLCEDDIQWVQKHWELADGPVGPPSQQHKPESFPTWFVLFIGSGIFATIFTLVGTALRWFE